MFPRKRQLLLQQAISCLFLVVATIHKIYGSNDSEIISVVLKLATWGEGDGKSTYVGDYCKAALLKSSNDLLLGKMEIILC